MTTLCAKAQKFHEQVLADLRLDELNISDRTKQCPSIKVNWLKTFIEEKKHLGVLERSVGIVTDQYVKEFGKEGVPKIKTKMEAESNERIVKLRKAIEEQREVIEYLEGVMKVMYSFGYELKNVIALLQLEK